MEDIEVGIIIPVGVVAVMMFGIVMTDSPYYEVVFALIAAFNCWCAGMNK